MCKIVKFRRVEDMVKLTETFAPLLCFQTYYIFFVSHALNIRADMFCTTLV